MNHDSEIICFSANRICHHDDYFLLVSKFTRSRNVKKISEKIKILFSGKSIVFMDIDLFDSFLTPLIVLRSLWGGKGMAISVRTDYLIQDISFWHFLKNMSTSKYFHVLVKRFFFFCIKNFSKTEVVSIHKNHPNAEKMKPYVNTFIYDPQLWDLEFLSTAKARPPEVPANVFNGSAKTILVAGRLNEQRSKDELLDYLKINKKYFFIVAGNIDDKDYEFLKTLQNVLAINRFMTNEEFLYLFDNSDIIYCFYTNDRPSGFFGRSLQLNKPVIVRKGTFLNHAFLKYKHQIPINSLEELDVFDFSTVTKHAEINVYNDSDIFKQLLQRL